MGGGRWFFVKNLEKEKLKIKHFWCGIGWKILRKTLWFLSCKIFFWVKAYFFHLLPTPPPPPPPPTAPLLARIFTDACNCISMQKINSIYQLILQTKQILQSHDLIVTSKATSSFSEFLSAFKKSNQFILSIQSWGTAHFRVPWP